MQASGEQRRGGQAGQQHRVRIREGQRLGIEDVGVEQPARIAAQLLEHPAGPPHREQRIAEVRHRVHVPELRKQQHGATTTHRPAGRRQRSPATRSRPVTSSAAGSYSRSTTAAPVARAGSRGTGRAARAPDATTASTSARPRAAQRSRADRRMPAQDDAEPPVRAMRATGSREAGRASPARAEAGLAVELSRDT